MAGCTGVALTSRLKQLARDAARRAGYEVVRVQPVDRRYGAPSFQTATPLPAGAADVLRGDNQRLAELRDRYARSSAPMAQRTMWRPSYLGTEVDLAHFRGDNSYVWQFRNVGAEARRKYYLYLRDLEARDERRLLHALDEDGAFGCWTFEFPGRAPVSRDLLDSINEIYFLHEHTKLLDETGWTILDIGAGYGRLAHRLMTAAPRLGTYVCLDAVAESTFLCEYYMSFRGLEDRVEVVPLDEIADRVAGRRADLALNIHSFSEMSTAAIRGWLEVVAAVGTQWLLIVPNDDDRLLSFEESGERRDFSALPGDFGYDLVQQAPVFADPTMCEMTAMYYEFFLYRRRGA